LNRQVQDAGTAAQAGLEYQAVASGMQPLFCWAITLHHNKNNALLVDEI